MPDRDWRSDPSDGLRPLTKIKKNMINKKQNLKDRAQTKSEENYSRRNYAPFKDQRCFFQKVGQVTSLKQRGKVWDLDGTEYIDMSIMGIGTNILGYGREEVDAAVIKTVQNGNMSTLNCQRSAACRKIITN